MSEPVSRRSDADIEKELVQLREMTRNQNEEIESLERERQEWIKFAEIDKAKIRTLETALVANLALLQPTYRKVKHMAYGQDADKAPYIENCDECGAETPKGARKDDLRRHFDKAHEDGAREFNMLWLRANNAATAAANALHVPVSDPIIRALLSCACLVILRDCLPEEKSQ